MTRSVSLDLSRLSRVLFGAVLAGIGLLILLDRMGEIQLGPLYHWWPMVLVALGLNKILQPAAERSTRHGLWLVVIGLWLQASSMSWFGLTFGNSWPLLLVLSGLDIILHAGHAGTDNNAPMEVPRER